MINNKVSPANKERMHENISDEKEAKQFRSKIWERREYNRNR